MSRTTTRKNITSCTPGELAAFAGALQKFKEKQTKFNYDTFVLIHYLAGEQRDAFDGQVIAAAHRGPSFLPWHRAMLLDVEQHLQKINPNVFIPVWNWDVPDGIAAPFASKLFGGNGVPPGFRVKADLFDGWVTKNPQGGVLAPMGPLERRFGSPNDFPTFHTVLRVLNQPKKYDTSPYNINASQDISFRNALERSLHDVIHQWVGGHMGYIPLAPNDPLFYMHHANADRIFAAWQLTNPSTNFPVNDPDLPKGQNPDDTLFGLEATINQIWDISDLGYTYQGLDLIGKPDHLDENQFIQSVGGGNIINESLVSRTGRRSELAMQGDGNLVIYNASGQAVWASNTATTNTILPYRAIMQGDGNFVVYDGNSGVVFATGTNGKSPGPYRAVMQGDESFVIEDGRGNALWSSKGARGKTKTGGILLRPNKRRG